MKFDSKRQKMQKKKQKDKTSLADCYKHIKGLGTMPEEDKKKARVSRFAQVLGKGK